MGIKIFIYICIHTFYHRLWDCTQLQLPGLTIEKNSSYVTVRPNCSGPSRQKVKNNVWKYLQTFVMGLHAVCEYKLAHLNRALSRWNGSVTRISKTQGLFHPHWSFETALQSDSSLNHVNRTNQIKSRTFKQQHLVTKESLFSVHMEKKTSHKYGLKVWRNLFIEVGLALW